jgi:hypothetical protein
VASQDGKPPRKKFVLGFTTLSKEVVLNATNKAALVAALGKTPANWIGAEIGLYTEPVMMAGKPTRGLRMRVLNKPSTASAPRPAPAAMPPDLDPPPADWPEGANGSDDFDQDVDQDFGKAAE